MVAHAYAKMGYREEVIHNSLRSTSERGLSQVLFERLGSMFLRLIGEAEGKALSMVCYG